MDELEKMVRLPEIQADARVTKRNLGCIGSAALGAGLMHLERCYELRHALEEQVKNNGHQLDYVRAMESASSPMLGYAFLGAGLFTLTTAYVWNSFSKRLDAHAKYIKEFRQYG